MAGTSTSGRRTLREELTVLRRFEDLSPAVFEFVQKMLASTKKEDKKWAADWIKPGYVKMIPQKIGGDPNNTTPIPIYGNFSIQGHNSNSQDIQPKQEN